MPSYAETIRPSPITPRLDERAVRWRLGLVALATDHTAERDFAAICPDREVGLYVARVAYANPTTVENLRAMEPRITEAAALILPGESLDALAFGCTSGSTVIGDEVVGAALQRAKPGVPWVTPASGARDALAALGVRRISVLTPYTAEVSESVWNYFRANGFEIASFTCLGMEDDTEMARIAPDSIVAAAVDACDPSAEALFISCTAVRAAREAERIEEALGKPVVTSNQAMFWRLLRSAGYRQPIPGFGRLLAGTAA